MSNKRFSMELFNLFLIIGAVFLLISEFIPWVSQNFSIYNTFLINNEIIYLFPIISAFITFFIAGYLIFSSKPNIGYISFIILMALSLTMLLLYQIIKDSGVYLFNSIGIYVGIIGFSLIFFGLFLMLINKTTETNENSSKLNKK